IKDLAPRDMISRAIYQEIKEGRGAEGKDYVYLDVRHLDPDVVEKKLPDVTEFARIYLGVEPLEEPVPIQPTAHYGMGGIPTDVDGRVVVGEAEEPVPGLYAAGECACVSVHGGNRLGTNSLLDIVVFGRRGGLDMARYARETDLPPLPDRPEADAAAGLRRLLEASGGDNFADIRDEMQEHMFDLAGVVRVEEGLRKVQELLGGLRERYGRAVVQDKGRVYNTDLMEAWELGALLDCADTLVAAALARDESRGGHYREDHPLRDDDHWLRHSLAYREADGSVRLEYKPVKMGPYVPMERKY
ncbi:MAG TPA: FAD-binding protein, partial [Actinomycetota bacterium]|nr:FAD-binding protein [Actinomycetota bacterium]